MKVRVGLFLICAASLLIAACGDSPTSALDDPGDGPAGGTDPVVSTIVIKSGPAALRQGEVAQYIVEARDENGAVVGGIVIKWSVLPTTAGYIDSEGQFVGYRLGAARIIAKTSNPAVGDAYAARDTFAVAVTERGGLTGDFTIIGRGSVRDRWSANLALSGDFAYTGTAFCDWGRECGDRLLVWDVSDPTNPVKTDEVVVGGSHVNGVRVSPDGRTAAITNEGALKDGMTFLDLSDPAHPTVINNLTDGLDGDTHNLYMDGVYAYVTVHGDDSRLAVVDCSDMQNPTVVASFDAGSQMQDVQVRNGLLMVSNTAGGLIILDVGGGGAGGSPTNPVELSRTRTPMGWTHSSLYWPATGYIFVSEAPEDGSDSATAFYVLDAKDPANPTQVAKFTDRTAPTAPPHVSWLDEARGILYVTSDTRGVSAIDVSGTLIGELDKQGRQIAELRYDPLRMSSSPVDLQVHNGLVYLTDFWAGLVVLQPSF